MIVVAAAFVGRAANFVDDIAVVAAVNSGKV